MTLLRTAPWRYPRALFGLICLAVLSTALVAAKAHQQIGLAVPEWPLAVDLFLTLPLAYLLIVRPAARQALLGVLGICALGILFGSIIIPSEDKVYWRWLEQLRWAALAALVAWQAIAIAGIIPILLNAPTNENLESRLHAALEQRFGLGPVTELLKLEGRMWLYGLCRSPSRLRFAGETYFAFKQGGNASNQAGFLFLVAFEIPLAHMLLHAIDPMIAVIVSASTLYGLLFLYAEYRATLLRPITLSESAVHLRYGLLADTLLPYEFIVEARAVSEQPRRASQRMRLTGMGQATVLLRLAAGTRLQTPFGARTVSELYIGLDEPDKFVRALSSKGHKRLG